MELSDGYRRRRRTNQPKTRTAVALRSSDCWAIMRHEYAKLIAEHDRTISMLRKQWMEAEPKDQPKYMERINAALDERLRLMALRDERPQWPNDQAQRPLADSDAGQKGNDGTT